MYVCMYVCMYVYIYIINISIYIMNISHIYYKHIFFFQKVINFYIILPPFLLERYFFVYVYLCVYICICIDMCIRMCIYMGLGFRVFGFWFIFF